MSGAGPTGGDERAEAAGRLADVDLAIVQVLAAERKDRLVPALLTEAHERRAADVVVAQDPAIDAAHIARQAAFSERTFGPGRRTEGVVDHIRKELREVLADPDDVGEWVDVVILGFDGAWRTGTDPQAIVDAIVAKQARNEARTWPDWRTVPAGQAIEHDRTGEVAAQDPAPQAVPARWLVEWPSMLGGWESEIADDAMGAEGVAYAHVARFRRGGDEDGASQVRVVALYRHPAPAPVVPDEADQATTDLRAAVHALVTDREMVDGEDAAFRLQPLLDAGWRLVPPTGGAS